MDKPAHPAAPPLPRLILWDVDSTLLLTDGISGKAMRAAMTRVFGPIATKDRIFFSGKTDWQIIQDMFPTLDKTMIAEQLATFSTTYVAELEQHRSDLVERSYTLPGVVPLLARLKEAGILQAPLTGNIAPVARIKLELLGLLDYLDIEAGAYGSDHYDRTQLVPIAARRATQRYDRPFPPNTIVVVGDTPNDIRCGKQNGTRTVAVATGPYTFDELRAHTPDGVLPDLSTTDTALTAILGSMNT